ncbi:gamma-crystallin N isoform X2 [Motacilla alba alba]|nr:gamma-crystallin N isoform X2 [Motacilla alba alba]
MHGEHYRIEIFEGSHFRGPSLELTEDCSFLQGQGWDKTCINALKVYGDGANICFHFKIHGWCHALIKSCCLRFVEVVVPAGSDDGSSGNMAMETNITLGMVHGGCCTRSPTTEAACTWWSAASSAASTSGRRAAPASSPSGESSTTSS